MIESLGFDIFARDRASATNKAVGKSAVQAAADIEAANLRVERATNRLAAATKKHGKDSLEARDASNKLTKAQLALDGAQAKTATSTEKAAASVGRFRAVAVAAGAIAGTALFGLGKAAVNTASDIAESQSKIRVVFGQSSAAVLKFADTTADSLGISKAAALDAAGTFGNLFVALKLPQPEAAKMSVRMVQLAADMASFNNTSPQEALEALRSGLVGETEPLRKYGVNIQDATLRQKALELGLISTTKDTLPPAIKAQASYALILDQTKTAQGDFARTADGLANSQRRATARMSDLGAELGGKLLPAVRSGTVSLLNLADAAERNSSTVVPAAVGIASLAASIFLVKKASAGLESAAGNVSSFTASLRAAEGVGGKFKAGISGLTSAVGGPLNLALAAGAIGIGLLVKAQMEAKARVKELTRTLDEQTGALTQNTRQTVFASLQESGAVRAAKELRVSLEDLTDAALGNSDANARVNASIDSFITAQTAARAGTRQGSRELQGFAMSANTVRDAVGGTNGEVRKAVDGFKDAKAAGAGAAGSADGLAASSTGAAGAMHDERTEAEKLKDSLDELTGKNIAADEAAIAYERSIDDLTDSIKENGHTLDIHTEKGRANRSALIDAAKAAMDHLVAMRDDGAALKDVTAKGESYRGQLIRQARQMGLTKAEAQRLIDKYLAVPKRVTTTASINAKVAMRAVSDLQARINALHGRTVSIGATAVFYGDGSVRRIDSRGNLGPIMKAAGGAIDGPGTETSDSIPARLSRGEHVISAREVKGAGGHGALEAMRSEWRSARRFATGGAVISGSPARVAAAIDLSIGRLTHLLIDRLIKNIGVGGGPALSWAKSQAGKPYIWGGVGPAGYDCSGFMSAITNVIEHRYPHARRFTTAGFPTSGWAPGPGHFMVGRFRGNPGHMAGTLWGTNVESSGTPGVRVGPSARGAYNSMFGGNVWHLKGYAAGGRVGDAPFDLLNPRGDEYLGDAVRDAVMRGRTFDGGGVATGRGLLVKATRQPERMLSAQQTRSFDRLVRVLDRGGGRGGDTYIVNINGVVSGSERSTEELVARAVKNGRKSGLLHRADFQ